MSERITKELREYISGCKADGAGCGALDYIADQIDADHERAVEKAHCEDISDIGDDELSSLYGLVRLPVDADGKPWHVGDKLSTVTPSGDDGGFEVTSFKLFANSVWIMTCTNDGHEVHTVLNPSECAHRKPTHAERIRAAVRVLTDEGGTDGPALKSLMDIADELEGDE